MLKLVLQEMKNKKSGSVRLCSGINRFDQSFSSSMWDWDGILRMVNVFRLEKESKGLIFFYSFVVRSNKNCFGFLRFQRLKLFILKL